MNNKTQLLVAVFMLFSGLASAQLTWTQVWADEFDYTGLPDPNKWGYDVGGSGWGNQESQYYTDGRLENAEVADGKLTITALKESFEGSDYTSTRLVSKGKGDWLYGRVEVMAKIPTGRGAWPAIWMLPTDNVYGNWPASGEIDIMENVGFDPNIIHWNVHTQAYNHTIGTNQGSSSTFTEPYNNYMEYAIEWYPDSVVFFVDDVQYYVFENEQATYAEWPFDQRFHLILNIAVGGSWGGLQGIDDNIFPLEMEVDYVRVYQLSDPNASHYDLSLNTEGNGTIQSNVPEGQVANGTAVELEAVPDAGYEFSGWTGTYSGGDNPLMFDMAIDADQTASFVRIGEMIVNGDFSSGGTEWWTNNGGSSTVDLQNGDANFDISSVNTNPWDKQLVQDDIPLINGHTYEVSFDAYSSEATTLVHVVGLNETPWTTYLYEVVNVGTGVATYTFTFTMTVDDPAGRVVFDLGHSTGNVHIDNISLVDLTITGVAASENIREARAFPNPTVGEVNLPEIHENVGVYTVDGMLIQSWSQVQVIDVSELKEGTYLLKFDEHQQLIQKQ